MRYHLAAISGLQKFKQTLDDSKVVSASFLLLLSDHSPTQVKKYDNSVYFKLTIGNTQIGVANGYM